jgi:hypothetical protein
MIKIMGKYCKAYHLRDMRKYRYWKENAQNTRKEKKEVDGNEVEEVRALTDDSIVYLQENYVVTDDIYKEQNILFDDTTPKWKEFCEDKLGFRVPDYDF